MNEPKRPNRWKRVGKVLVIFLLAYAAAIVARYVLIENAPLNWWDLGTVTAVVFLFLGIEELTWRIWLAIWNSEFNGDKK